VKPTSSPRGMTHDAVSYTVPALPTSRPQEENQPEHDTLCFTRAAVLHKANEQERMPSGTQVE